MSNVNLRASGLPETVLPPVPNEIGDALSKALAIDDDKQKRSAVCEVVAKWPQFLEGWAHVGFLGRDDIERYAAFRVGYHRGLDQLRQNGWRGSGFVRWEHQQNRGFLMALAGLGQMADRIGETDEADRCSTFLLQLEPNWEADWFKVS